eukprot:gene13978-14095_t
MKKYLYFIVTLCITVCLISWGKTGHRTIGLIAQNHLTVKAKAAIHELIGDTSLADISTYADEIRSTERYRYTTPWHYINLETGLSYDQFAKAVREQTNDNVYNALKKLELDLVDPSKSKAEKVFALKLVVHFIGDLHQPMHVSRAEDRGGNAIKISFEGQKGNLHGLWDSGLIDHQGLSYQQLASKYDHAAPEQVSLWQHQGMITWLYESYQVSSQLYQDAASNPNFDEQYYAAHLTIISDRIEKAGIRLAGVLNEAFGGGPYQIILPPPVGPVKENVAAPKQQREGITKTIGSAEVKNYTGQTVKVTGTISTTRLIESNQMTLLNVGAAYPNQDFTIIIRGENRGKFNQPDVNLKGKTVAVTGMVIDYRGQPEIEITDPSQLTVN